MRDVTQQGFWLAKLLYGEDNDLIFFNTAHIVSIEVLKDDDEIIGYSIHTVDDEEYEVSFKTGPLAHATRINNLLRDEHQPLFA